MPQVTFGDLSTAYYNQLHNTRLRMTASQLGQELASGRTSNLRQAAGGDLGNYAGIENALTELAAYQITAKEAALFMESTQRSLETVQQTTTDIAPALLMAGSSSEATLVQSTAADARARFATVVSVLNTRVADRAVLAGTAIDGAALADSETMLAYLNIAIAAETSAAGITAVVDAWFDDSGGGFETSGYLGETTDLAPFRIGPDEKADFTLRGDDQSLRDLMKGYAIAALVADGALSAQHSERVTLVSTAATRLLTSDKGLVEIRAAVGGFEAQIEGALARNGAETSALEIARSEIAQIDPFEAATNLQATETQLEMLYTITARLSRLSLADYLR